ncbi:MAG: hypothetical protein QS721_10490 [Candidatus Endonucleobacter sp. (ex Gigantidas childressi)]|nr:hypothetical protein [Candidatus Endonucleobacter sp. (ex Gigantidas childressi)]
MGLAKNATIYGLAAIAANIRKGTKFLVLYGVSKPCYTDRYVKNQYEALKSVSKTNDLMFNALESFVMADKTWKVQLP